MASTVLQAYLLPALTAVSTIPLISASLDHPLVHLDHCRPPDSLSLAPFYSFLFIYSAHPFHSLSLWLTVCCGTETAPGWRCLSPQGGRGPTSGRGSEPQGGAAPAWPHTMSTSSSREKKECHQLRSGFCIPVWSAVKWLLSVRFTGGESHRVFLTLIKSPNLEALVFASYFEYVAVWKPLCVKDIQTYDVHEDY